MFLITERIKSRLPFLKAIVRPSSFSQPFCFSSTPVLEIAASSQVPLLNGAFKSFGSDKSTLHDYHIPYSWILNQLPKGYPLLEIGIGTNNINIDSNMGVNGKPGASLRAWKSLNHFSVILGADIDQDCLFQEREIATYFVDQLKEKTIEHLRATCIEQGYDNPALIIDDGLHTLKANQNTIDVLFDYLRPGGFYVIEDITANNVIPLIEYGLRFTELSKIHVWGNRSRGENNNLLILRK
jgi:hypothetical protein